MCRIYLVKPFVKYYQVNLKKTTSTSLTAYVGKQIFYFQDYKKYMHNRVCQITLPFPLPRPPLAQPGRCKGPNRWAARVLRSLYD